MIVYCVFYKTPTGDDVDELVSVHSSLPKAHGRVSKLESTMREFFPSSRSDMWYVVSMEVDGDE